VALTPGTRIGPYEITALIGEGGMGKVWRAHHTALNRDDALKVLPEAFASDPDRLARFRREARVLASLNHPNIAHVYGLEQAGGVQALVMELVEGPTLADRIAQGPIPIDEALPIARQIAEGLEAAHEQGIIHRDLKPANIKVRPDGTVKVLDFGLAKLTESTAATTNPSALSMSPTITSPALMSGVGVLLGTAAYMSPEQARGRTIDRRADIWAFGVVLFEMLSGKRAFEDEDVSMTLSKVLQREPNFDALPPAVPAHVRQALRVCLRKDAKQRVSDIRDVHLALEGAFESASAQESPPVAVNWRRTTALTASAVCVGAVIAGAAVWMVMRPAASRIARTEITTSGAPLDLTGSGRDLVVTPDGSRIVYRSVGQILVRALDQLDPTPLRGVADASDLFLSPDGQWVGFFDRTVLKKVAITGASPVTVCDANGVARGATWGDDGTIIFSTTGLGTGLQRVSAAGGTPTVLTKPNREAGELDHRLPQFLPGSQAVLFTIVPLSGMVDGAQIAVLDLRTGTYKVLIRGGTQPHYVRSGHLVYAVGATLRAVTFDPSRLEITGAPVPVVPQRVSKLGGLGGASDFDVAENGTLVYVSGSAVRSEARRKLFWVDRQGREQLLSAPERAYLYPRMSPDGTRVALAISDQQADIWTWDLARETLTRVTFSPAPDSYPVWTPDSRRVIFGSATDTGVNLFWQAADGTGAPERLTESSYNQQAFSISPDGSRVVLRQGLPPYDLNLLLLGDKRRIEPLIRTPFNESDGEISPDGRWLAYDSNESGQQEVYVRPFPNVEGGRWQVSTAGGSRPLWARNGQELFFAVPNREDVSLMSVRVQTGPTWSASTPTKLFAGRFFFADAPGQLGQGRTYDIAPDGRRFLMIKDGSPDSSIPYNSIIVVHGWFEDLKRLVPTP
jgi:serine/threonine-protein kinase